MVLETWRTTFYQKEEVGETVFEALNTVKNFSLDSYQKSLTQNKITDFFTINLLFIYV